MPVDPPFNVYRDQLTSLYHGLALWNPNPPKSIYDHVSIGDVGYVREGVFIRMFNVILPWDHESNGRLGEPERYESLECGPFTKTLEVPLKTQEHYSSYVSSETNDSNAQAREPDNAEGVTYNCRGHGALLFLPHGGRRVDIILTKVFEHYIRDHVVSWFTWAQKNGHGIERMEDLILVSGCTLVSSWAAAAFVNNTMEAKISLARRTLNNGGECFVWGNIRGTVEYHDSDINPQYPPTTPATHDQCVFIRGFRAKRVLFWTKPMRAAAEPRPDDPENRSDDIQVTRVPDGPKYRDPLIGILDYIIEKCPKDAKAEDTIAIVHDDDLRLIKDVEILTADAVEEFLREKQMPLLVENGTAILLGSPGKRHLAVERHEDQSQKEAPPPRRRRRRHAKAAPISSLGNRQSHTPQLGSLLASRASQTTAERRVRRSQQRARLHRPTKVEYSNRPQGSQLASRIGLTMPVVEKHEDPLSSTGKAMFPPSNIKLFTDAMANYTRITGVDLFTNPFAETLEQSDSLEAILQLLREREKTFKKFRNRHRRLMNYVTPCVEVLHAISRTHGDLLSFPSVPLTPAKAVFVGIDVLLVTSNKVSSNYSTLLNLFESLENILKRLEVIGKIPPTMMMASGTDILIKIMIESLLLLALVTKEIKQGRLKKFVKSLWRKDKIQASLQRLDRLTRDEDLTAGLEPEAPPVARIRDEKDEA